MVLKILMLECFLLFCCCVIVVMFKVYVIDKSQNVSNNRGLTPLGVSKVMVTD